VSSFGVVLDACVLIPASLRDTLLRAAEQGMYQLHWSELILEEVRRNLVKRDMTSSVDAFELTDVMSEFFAEAFVRGFETLVPCMTNDEKDRHVLAVAVMSRSQVIVTSNIRDFPGTALDPFGIEAQTPDEFLTNLFDLNPKRLVKILTEQAQDLVAPPISVQEVLAELALIEATHSQGIRRSALRRSRYIGLDKTHLQHILIATALNFIRLDAWLSGVPLAKTRFSRFKQLQKQPP